MATSKRILVLGACGFLGKFVLKRMVIEGFETRILTRGSDDWQSSLISQYRSQGIDVRIGDIFDDATLQEAMQGVGGIVNLVGTFNDSEDGSFEEVHVDLVKRLLEFGGSAGVQRFVHVSCLGATDNSDSRYFKTKKESEKLVENSSMYWTIFRPSYLFGETFPLLQLLAPLVKFKLFLPVIGSGTNTIQPVYVGDVANCVSQCIFDQKTVRQSYELVGPEQYKMTELLENVRAELGIKGPTMNIPSEFSGRTFDLVAKALPKSFFSSNFASIFSHDSNGSQDVMLRHFEVRNKTLDEYFMKIMDSM